MKSQIKVDYKSRYGDGDFGEKEPLVRVDVVQSDDPRDTLLYEIFRDDGFLKIGGSSINPANSVKQFVLFRRKEREIWINDIMSPMFLALVKYTGINANFVTGSDNMWFELVDDYSVRSKGITERELNNIQYDNHTDLDRKTSLQDRVIKEWKQFEEEVKNSKK